MLRWLSNTPYQQLRRSSLSIALTRGEGENEQMYSEEVEVTLYFLPCLSSLCDRWHLGLSKSRLHLEILLTSKQSTSGSSLCLSLHVPDSKILSDFRGSFGTGGESRSGLSSADSDRGKRGVVAQRR